MRTQTCGVVVVVYYTVLVEWVSRNGAEKGEREVFSGGLFIADVGLILWSWSVWGYTSFLYGLLVDDLSHSSGWPSVTLLIRPLIAWSVHSLVSWSATRSTGCSGVARSPDQS